MTKRRVYFRISGLSARSCKFTFEWVDCLPVLVTLLSLSLLVSGTLFERPNSDLCENTTWRQRSREEQLDQLQRSIYWRLLLTASAPWLSIASNWTFKTVATSNVERCSLMQKVGTNLREARTNEARSAFQKTITPLLMSEEVINIYRGAWCLLGNTIAVARYWNCKLSTTSPLLHSLASLIWLFRVEAYSLPLPLTCSCADLPQYDRTALCELCLSYCWWRIFRSRLFIWVMCSSSFLRDSFVITALV